MKLRGFLLLIVAALCLAAVSCGKKGDPFLPARQESEVRAPGAGENARQGLREEPEEEAEVPNRK